MKINLKCSYSIIFALMAINAAVAEQPNPGRYDPRLGHSSLEEDIQIIRDFAPLAQTFGRKHYSAASSRNHRPLQLECQAETDPNYNHTTLAPNWDSIKYVNGRLTTLHRCVNAANTYRASPSSGGSILVNYATDKFGVHHYPLDGNYFNRMAATTTDKSDLLSLVKSRFAQSMAADCKPGEYPGWEKYPVVNCQYHVRDTPISSPTKQLTKMGQVLMLNPTPEQATAWIISACKLAPKNKNCESVLAHVIHDSSGFQFPVAGIVYEDLYPLESKSHPKAGDGVFESYCFRNGVTVDVAGLTSGGTKPLTQSDIDNCLYGEIREVKTYARIHGGTREDYTKNGGNEDVGTSQKGKRKEKWMDVIRESYQSAWDSDNYSLLDAWVIYGHLDEPQFSISQRKKINKLHNQH